LRGTEMSISNFFIIEGPITYMWCEDKKGNGILTSLDTVDWYSLNELKWIPVTTYRNYTAIKSTTGTYIHHHIILNRTKAVVDHIDRNPLNNCRSNLRECTYQENSRNTKARSNARSRWKGVRDMSSMPRLKSIWQATIRTGKVNPSTRRSKRITLGYFAYDGDAAMAYNEAAAEHFGEFAVLNESEFNSIEWEKKYGL
jgi:hypothetical protein